MARGCRCWQVALLWKILVTWLRRNNDTKISQCVTVLNPHTGLTAVVSFYFLSNNDSPSVQGFWFANKLCSFEVWGISPILCHSSMTKCFHCCHDVLICCISDQIVSCNFSTRSTICISTITKISALKQLSLFGYAPLKIILLKFKPIPLQYLMKQILN